MTRAARFARNLASSYLRWFVNAALLIVLTPYVIRSLGGEAFGVWSLVLAIVGLAGIVDMGLATTVVKVAAARRSADDVEARNRELSTAFAVYVLLSAVALLGVALFGGGITSVLGIPAGLKSEFVAVLWILSLRGVILLLPLSLWRGVLFGSQAASAINIVQIGTSVALAAMTWGALEAGLGIVALATVHLVVMLVEHAAYFVIARRSAPGLRIDPRLADIRSLRSVLSFSAFSFLGTAAGLILLRTDPVIVKLFLPLSAVGAYAVALKVVENLTTLLKQLTNLLAPIAAELHGNGDINGLSAIFVQGTRFAIAGALAVCLPVVMLSGPIVRAWIGPEMAEAAPILSILACATILSVPQLVASSVLSMSGHHRFTGWVACASAVTNVALSLGLVGIMGMTGVALATLVCTILFDGIVVTRKALEVAGLGVIEWMRVALAPSLLPSLALGSFLAVGMSGFRSATLLELAATCVIGGVIFVAVFCLTGLGPAERSRIVAWVRFRLPRIAQEGTR